MAKSTPRPLQVPPNETTTIAPPYRAGVNKGVAPKNNGRLSDLLGATTIAVATAGKIGRIKAENQDQTDVIIKGSASKDGLGFLTQAEFDLESEGLTGSEDPRGYAEEKVNDALGGITPGTRDNDTYRAEFEKRTVPHLTRMYDKKNRELRLMLALEQADNFSGGLHGKKPEELLKGLVQLEELLKKELESVNPDVNVDRFVADRYLMPAVEAAERNGDPEFIIALKEVWPNTPAGQASYTKSLDKSYAERKKLTDEGFRASVVGHIIAGRRGEAREELNKGLEVLESQKGVPIGKRNAPKEQTILNMQNILQGTQTSSQQNLDILHAVGVINGDKDGPLLKNSSNEHVVKDAIAKRFDPNKGSFGIKDGRPDPGMLKVFENVGWAPKDVIDWISTNLSQNDANKVATAYVMARAIQAVTANNKDWELEKVISTKSLEVMTNLNPMVTHGMTAEEVAKLITDNQVLNIPPGKIPETTKTHVRDNSTSEYLIRTGPRKRDVQKVNLHEELINVMPREYTTKDTVLAESTLGNRRFNEELKQHFQSYLDDALEWPGTSPKQAIHYAAERAYMRLREDYAIMEWPPNGNELTVLKRSPGTEQREITRRDSRLLAEAVEKLYVLGLLPLEDVSLDDGIVFRDTAQPEIKMRLAWIFGGVAGGQSTSSGKLDYKRFSENWVPTFSQQYGDVIVWMSSGSPGTYMSLPIDTGKKAKLEELGFVHLNNVSPGKDNILAIDLAKLDNAMTNSELEIERNERSELLRNLHADMRYVWSEGRNQMEGLTYDESVSMKDYTHEQWVWFYRVALVAEKRIRPDDNPRLERVRGNYYVILPLTTKSNLRGGRLNRYPAYTDPEFKHEDSNPTWPGMEGIRIPAIVKTGAHYSFEEENLIKDTRKKDIEPLFDNPFLRPGISPTGLYPKEGKIPTGKMRNQPSHMDSLSELISTIVARYLYTGRSLLHPRSDNAVEEDSLYDWKSMDPHYKESQRPIHSQTEQN